MILQTAPEPILLDFYRRRLRCGLSVVWWRSGQGVGLATPKVAGSTPGLALSGNNLGQVVHPHVPLSLSSTGQRAVMPCGWESNRRSGIAQTSVVYPPTCSRLHSSWAWHTLPFSHVRA